MLSLSDVFVVFLSRDIGVKYTCTLIYGNCVRAKIANKGYDKFSGLKFSNKVFLTRFV